MVRHRAEDLTPDRMEPVSEAASNTSTAIVPVVTLEDGVPVADSRDVAAMFGKRHDNVMRDIRGLLKSEDTPAGLFRPSTYVDDQNGRAYPHYLMDRDGFSLLAMGFTGPRALQWKVAYMQAFNGMEDELRQRSARALTDLSDPATLRGMLLGYTEKVLALEAKVVEVETRAVTAEATVEEQRPLVDAYHAFLDDDGLCCLATAVAAIEAPQGLFFAWMRERGYLFDRDGFLQPRADLRKDGYFKLRTVPGEYHRMKGQTKVTRPGLIWLRHRWLAGPGKLLALQAAVAASQPGLPGI